MCVWLGVWDKNQISLGEFGKLPATLGASNPGLTSLMQVRLLLLMYYLMTLVTIELTKSPSKLLHTAYL
jgi:hypothetical protein